jgi:HAD superfamily hydrolase (TIGR01450 family)
LTWALDLDGVVWLAGRGIAGSAEAVSRLREAGERVVFLTNNSGPTVAGHLAALANVGIEVEEEDLVTSAQAAASLISRGTKVAVVGDEGIRQALRSRGALEVGPADGPQAIVIGRTVHLDYWALTAASSAIRGGARFIATNTDATFPVGATSGTDPAKTVGATSGKDGRAPVDGLLPGAGALVAFVATASGQQPEVAGKPHQAMAALVAERLGAVDVVVGDRPDTDGLFARLVRAKFALVLSGVTRRADLPVHPSPDLVGEDLSVLVNEYLERRVVR